MTITITFRNLVRIRWALQYKPVFPALGRLSKRIRSTRPAWAIHGDPLAWTTQWNPVSKRTKQKKKTWQRNSRRMNVRVVYSFHMWSEKRNSLKLLMYSQQWRKQNTFKSNNKVWLTNKKGQFSVAYLTLNGLSHGVIQGIQNRKISLPKIRLQESYYQKWLIQCYHPCAAPSHHHHIGHKVSSTPE